VIGISGRYCRLPLFRNVAIMALAVVGFAAMVVGSLAQTSQPAGKQASPSPTQPTSSEVPQLTTATYDDWTVSCRTSKDSGETSCEMTQVQTIKGQKNPVGQVTFTHTAKDAPITLVVQIPPTLWIETGVKVTFDEKDPGFPVTVKWCAPSRCFAQSELSKDQIAKLRARTDPATIEFKEASQRQVSLPVSFDGFASAFEAILKK
jgi:invasion protein IalB